MGPIQDIVVRIVRRGLELVGRIGAGPSDTPEDRLRKSVLVLFALFAATFTPWEGIGYLFTGYRLQGAMMVGYSLVSAVSIGVFALTRHEASMRALQLTLVLVFPFAYQWSFGGFARSGGVGLWSLLAPLGALMLHGVRGAIPWFGAYVLATLGSAATEVFAPVHPSTLPPRNVTFFLPLNLVTLGVMVFTLLAFFVRQRDVARAALEREHERSEKLLLNILPAPIADRLKSDQRTIADGFGEVSVLFADIVGFTKLSARVPPAELVALLNRLFTAFDALAERHGLEKIKTIGDAYMVAAGLPVTRPDHAVAIAEMALDMQDAVTRFAAEIGEPLSVRIGVNSGPVVAGVIGTRKFIYDLWGDTVNTASRMESHGIPGRIHVTDETRALLNDAYDFEDRGTQDVKGKGPMHTWLLLGRRTTTGAA